VLEVCDSLTDLVFGVGLSLSLGLGLGLGLGVSLGLGLDLGVGLGVGFGFGLPPFGARASRLPRRGGNSRTSG
jgi:hypothetical protein